MKRQLRALLFQLPWQSPPAADFPNPPSQSSFLPANLSRSSMALCDISGWPSAGLSQTRSSQEGPSHLPHSLCAPSPRELIMEAVYGFQ